MSASTKKKLRNEQKAALLTEKQQNERKEAKKLKIQTTVFVAVVALVLVIGLVSIGISAFNQSGILERGTTAITIGDHKLNSTQLNYFYIDTINNTYTNWYNYYGDYTSTYVMMLYGLDMTQPLNEQMFDEEAGTTFADYFAELAVDSAVGTYAAYDKAMAENYQLNETQKATVDTVIKNFETTAANGGYPSLKECLQAYYGAGASEKTLREYLEIVALADAYKTNYYNELSYDEAALNAYSEEHFNDYSSFSYATFTMSNTDFIVCTAEEGDTEHKHTDEEKAAGAAAAEKAANALMDSKPANAEEFDEAIKAIDVYAESDTAVSIKYNDTLYTSITNTDIASWVVEEGRQIGDMKIITNTNTTTNEDGTKTETVNGYTLVLFLGENDNTMPLVNVRHILNSFQGGTTDENGNTVYSDEDKKTTLAAIELIRDSWLAAEKTEEAFAKLATAHTNDAGSLSNGGLYTNVYPGQTVTAFNDWCFAEGRQAGDYDIIETEYGYHLVYFVGYSDVTYRNYMIENDMRSNDYNAWYTELAESVGHEVLNTSKLSLDFIIMG